MFMRWRVTVNRAITLNIVHCLRGFSNTTIRKFDISVISNKGLYAVAQLPPPPRKNWSQSLNSVTCTESKPIAKNRTYIDQILQVLLHTYTDKTNDIPRMKLAIPHLHTSLKCCIQAVYSTVCDFVPIRFFQQEYKTISIIQ
jgi:hypothetical protein